MSEPRPAKGWKNRDGSEADGMWEIDIPAMEANPGDYLLYKNGMIACLGKCQFHGNPHGYWNGARWDFQLPPEETLVLIYAV